MRSTILKTLLAFGAGAACATVIAGYENPPIPLGEWQKLGNQTLINISRLGGQVAHTGKGLVHLHPFSVDACMVPPPKPNEIDPRTFELGIMALRELYKAHQVGNSEPILMTDRCHPY